MKQLHKENCYLARCNILSKPTFTCIYYALRFRCCFHQASSRGSGSLESAFQTKPEQVPMFARTEAFTMSFVGLEREIKGSLGPFWGRYLGYKSSIFNIYSTCNVFCCQ